MKESKASSDMGRADSSCCLGVFRTPTTALLGGVAFAIGHHFFYRSLEGQAPPQDTSDTSYGLLKNLSGQQRNIAVGTLLAFLVKALLGITISRAQDQFSWQAIKDRPTELRLIDSLLCAQSSIIDVFNFRLWLRHPFAMIIVVVYCPITRAVSQSLLASAVLPLTAPFPNSTYHVDFQGPALRCSEIERGSPLWTEQSKNIHNASAAPWRCYQYLAWPGEDPFPWTRSDNYWGFNPPKGLVGPGFTVIAVGDGCSSAEAPNITLVQCQMWNATYSAYYSYDNGVQDVVSNVTLYESPFDYQPVAITSNAYPELDNPENYMLLWSYMAVLEAFQDYIVGSIYQDPDELDLSFTVDGNVLVTALAAAAELSYLKSDIAGLASDNAAITMAEGIEEMFRNATLSLMSQDLLLITKFSTILRVAYNVRISSGVDLSETSGKDPLPERLKKSHVSIPPEGVSVLSMDSDRGDVQTDAQDWHADRQGSYDEGRQ
ncbi:hypothetical protein LQW54_002402 [Pestalotiopsis sp. IQ-011]